MRLDRFHGDAQGRADTPIGLPVHDQPQNAALTIDQ